MPSPPSASSASNSSSSHRQPPITTDTFQPGFTLKNTMYRLKSFLTPTQSSTSVDKTGAWTDHKRRLSGSFTTAKTAVTLFPPTNPADDGDDCLHDCETCTVALPRKWEIEEKDDLYGHVKGWDYHLLVATGKTDWVRDVEEERGSLMEAVGQKGLEVYGPSSTTLSPSPLGGGGGATSTDNGQDGTDDTTLGNDKSSSTKKRQKRRVMLSACNMPTGGAHDGDVDAKGNPIYENDGQTRCILLPSWKLVEGVTRKDVNWLMDDVVGESACNVSPLFSSANDTANGTSEGDENQSSPAQKQSHILPASSITSTPTGVTISSLPHRYLILLCSHRTRDARCGQSAPLLRKEFERHLRPLGMYRDLHDLRPGGVGIYFINHVGGHKYSANVMIYRREASQQQQQQPHSKESSIDSIDSGNGDGDGESENKNKSKKKDDKKEIHPEAMQGIWLARVRPEDCENIIRYTVLQGKLVKPLRQLRGGFDRSQGLRSW